jgi:excisionase family DNA binding protein
MAGPHLFRAYSSHRWDSSLVLGVFRPHAGRLVHLVGIDATTTQHPQHEHSQLHLIEQVLSLSELCEHLHVSAQTIYDLRSQGRGPKGFRVGRELRFRISEIEAWLARMESADEQRHPSGGR